MNPADLPAGTVYVPVLAGSTKPLPVRPVGQRVQVYRAHGRLGGLRPWIVAGSVRGFRDFESFEDARLFVVALLDGKA